MGAQGKYNLLFIHDDGATRSFRISRAALRSILIALVLLPILSAAGLWAGWLAWERGQAWTAEQQTLQRELVALKVQLARLSNVEALMRISETGPLPGEPGALPVSVASGAPSGGAGTTTSTTGPTGPTGGTAGTAGAAGAAGTTGPAGSAGASAAGTTGTPGAAATPAGAGTAGSSATTAGAAGAPTNGAGTASGVTGASGEAAIKGQAASASGEATTESANPDLAVIDKNVVSLGNVSARLGEDRRLRVRLDLHNDSGQQVSGKIEYFIVTTDGQRTPLPSSDASFRISRLKKFVTSSLVPDALSNLTNASLLVEVVNSDGDRLFRQLYPISD